MSGSAGGWRVAARLARREVRRRPGRTALVTALVAVPVAGMLMGVAFMRTGELSSIERWRFDHGRADAVMYRDTAVTPGPLPEGSRTIDYLTIPRIVGTAGGELCRCSLSDVPFEPLTDGIVLVSAGRPPERPGEVLLSETAADALGTGLGERIELTRPFELDATVVGLGHEGVSPDSAIVVLDPAAGLLDHDDPMANVQRLVDLPDRMTPDEVASWEQRAGAHALSPAYPTPVPMSTEVSNENANVGVRWTWAGGAAGLTVLGIVIAAAFAASARRQLVTLGQLAANGGTPALLRRVLFLQGTVTGLLGTVAGLGLGVVGLAAARPWAEQLMGHAYVGWEVRLLDVLPIVAIGLVASTVAALVPAFGASRVSVLTALAGRRPLGRVSRRRTALGLLAIVAGTGLLGFAAGVDGDATAGGLHGLATAGAVAGPVLLLLGVCTATPAYVTVLRPAARLGRGHWRLAARSLFRQRTRTSAMVSAICAISAVAVAVATVGLAVERGDRERQAASSVPDDMVRVGVGSYHLDGFAALPSPGVLADAARDAQAMLPAAERYDLGHAADPVERTEPQLELQDYVIDDPDPDRDSGDDDTVTPQSAIVVDDGLRRAAGFDAATLRLLDEVGAVWFGPADGRVSFRATPRPGTMPPFDFIAAVVGPGHAYGFGPRGELLLTPQRAEDLGLVAAPAEVVLRTPKPLTGAQFDALGQLSLKFEAESQDAALAAGDPLAASDPRVWLAYEQHGAGAATGLIETVPAAVALLFALFVVAVGLALAAAETRDERDVLTVLGTPPRTLRRSSGSKAFLLTLLGGVVAVPVGLVPVAVVYHLAPDGDVVVPWRTIALLVVAVPVLAAAITSTAARLAARVRPLRISTATFE